jgi:hypothetical protein
MSTIIETELVRAKLWSELREKIISLKLFGMRLLTYKENSNLILRYLFNKIITKKISDDPVFIISKSLLAENQLILDLKYFKINNNPINIINIIEQHLTNSFNTLKTISIKEDQKVEEKNGIIYYGIHEYPNNLKCDSYLLPYAFALHLRYNYINLSTHGLANNYFKQGFNPSDNIIEGFASSFNHYFNRYHSAFPDLEKVFGSSGSFFDCDKFQADIVVCNPPFDISVMNSMINKIKNILERQSNIKFILTFPYWTDYQEMIDLQNYKHTKSFKIIKKKETEFIDYISKKIIQPCDIVEVIVSNN